METIVGIDLGTTNSEIAVLRDGGPEVIEAEGEKILPSAVGLDAGGQMLVGTAARNQAAVAPDRTVLSVKRWMGTETSFRIGEQAYTPQEISAMILRTLKARAEQALGHAVSKAVITVPAYFKEAQREATREAGELAGLEVVRILNEPTAAALAYEPHPERRERVLVYDFGGGTFDVSIVQLEQQVVEVLASQGDTELGGDDLDRSLLDHVCDRFREAHGVDLREDTRSRSRVLRAVEEARKQLSFEPLVGVQAEFIAEDGEGTPLHLDEPVERADYEGLIEPLLQRTLECVDQALSDAALRADQIDQVVLVGGTTRTPRVYDMLEQRLDQTPHGEVEPDLCVALGAAIQGAMIAGRDVDRVLVDITPHTLGIEALGVQGGRETPYFFSPIIKRNTALPASRTEMYATSYEGQDAAWIRVFQGEGEDTRNNTLLGEFLLEGLTDQPQGSRIPVRFDLNLDGMLTVTATEHATGHSEKLTIDNAMTRFRQIDREAARQRIDAAMGEPSPQPGTEDEAEAPAASSNADTAAEQANQLLEKADRLAERAEGEDAEDLRTAMAAVREAVQSADETRIQRVLPELEDLVFYLEEV